ncbi:MAG: zinc-ribbon domain-containing protein, partial [Olsenella umbonata]|nr:zinc-ribbon domain-containing protein [Parafannyhessea umbonata]
MFCTNCGAKIKPGTRFCPQCGADLSAMADANEIAADEMAAGETPGDAQDLTQPMPPAHASWKPRQASDEDAGQDEQQATSPQAMAGGAVAPREVPQAPARPKAGSLRPDPERGGRKVALIALGVLALCAAAVAGVILGVMPMLNANHKEPSI